MKLTILQEKIKNIDFNEITAEDAQSLLNELFDIKDDDVFLKTSYIMIDLMYKYSNTAKNVNPNVYIIFEDEKLNDYYTRGCEKIIREQELKNVLK